MWMARRMIASQSGEAGGQVGTVTGLEGGRVSVQGETGFYGLMLAAPWGIASLPPEQAQAVILPGGPEDGIFLGTVSETGGLEAGELRLRSAGGAEIYLKKNGDVVINGQVFAIAATADRAATAGEATGGGG